MDKKQERLIQRTMDVQRELTKSGLNRRNLLKLGVLSAGTGMLLPIPGLSLRAAWAGVCPIPGQELPAISPRVTPFKDPLQRLEEMTPQYSGSVAGLTDTTFLRGGKPGHAPTHALDSKLHLLKEHPELSKATPHANLAHQAWDGTDRSDGTHNAPKDFYEMRAIQHRHIWHSEMPAGASGQLAWGFADRDFNNATQVTGQAGVRCTGVPGPVFRLRYGRSHLVRLYNELPEVSPLGFGSPIIATHMHNHHTPSESDGGPLYYNYPGHFWDYHYPNLYAGINQWNANGAARLNADKAWNPSGVRGDFREALGSLWFHDHKHDFTSQNVYAGLFGACPIYDDVDNGDENVPGTTKVAFPTHSDDWQAESARQGMDMRYEFDVPLMVHDRQFDPQGVDFFPLACFDGALGDRYTVNGTIQPYMNVQPRRYRFRVYVGGPSRFMWWWMRQGAASSSFLPMTVIANDGNLLERAVSTTNFKHAPGERFDIIVDFTGMAEGTEIYLTNRAEQTNGRGPNGKLLAPGASPNVIKFVVQKKRVGLTDRSTKIVNGMPLRPLPEAVNVTTAKRKLWVWGRSNGVWDANGTVFDRFAAPYEVAEGSSEIWTHKNGGGSWSHPIHPHFEEGRIIARKGTAQPDPTSALEAKARKDVVRLDPSASADVAMRFRDYKGIYPMHCHNVVHEDHGMMAMFKIV